MIVKTQIALFPLYSKILILLLLLSSGLRAVFYLYNSDYFSGVSALDLLLAFVHGIRFDASVAALLLAVWLLIAMPLYLFKWTRALRYTGYYYLPLLPIILIATNVADSLYFPFTGRRSGAEVMAFSQDISNQGLQLVQQYWLSALISTLITIAISVYTFKLVRQAKTTNTKWYFRVWLCLVLVIFSALTIRSSLGTKPLKPLNAFNWPSPDTGHLVLNSTFTLLRQDTTQLEPLNFFNSDTAAKQLIDQGYAPHGSISTIRKDNVVILILESFALEYLTPNNGAKGYAPFLQDLSTKSLYFSQAYANGRRSIDALPSVLASLPPLMKEPFITSAYLGVKVEGVANVLADRGYDSWFFHGASNGSMYIDTMSKRFGFNNFVGLNEYPTGKDFDGSWGVFDEPFLGFMATKLNSLKQPFIAGAFTLSSHNPYPVPNKFKDKFTVGSLPIHRSIGYTDYALQQFFDQAKKMPWYNNTLFVITADHTSISDNPVFQNALGRHRVPILFYSPNGNIAPQFSEKIAQQTDIGATILDYLGLSKVAEDRLMPFGKSLLRKNEGEAFFTESGRYVLVNKEASMSANSDFSQLTFSLNKESNADPLEQKRIMLLRLKAKVQLHNNGMIGNSFYQ